MLMFLQYMYYVRILCATLNDSHYIVICSRTLTVTEQYMYFAQ